MDIEPSKNSRGCTLSVFVLMFGLPVGTALLIALIFWMIGCDPMWGCQ